MDDTDHNATAPATPHSARQGNNSGFYEKPDTTDVYGYKLGPQQSSFRPPHVALVN